MEHSLEFPPAPPSANLLLLHTTNPNTAIHALEFPLSTQGF